MRILLLLMTTTMVVAEFVFTPPPSSTTSMPKTSKTDTNIKTDSEPIIDLKSLKPATQDMKLNLKAVVKDTVPWSGDKTPVREDIYQKELFQLYNILQQMQNDSAEANETFAKRLMESSQQNQPHIVFPHTIDDRSRLFGPTFQSIAPPFQSTVLAPELASSGLFLEHSRQIIPFDSLNIGHGVNSHLKPFNPSPALFSNSFDTRHLLINGIFERSDPFLTNTFAPNSLHGFFPVLSSNNIFGFPPDINRFDPTTVPSHLVFPNFNQISTFPPIFIPQFPVTNPIPPPSANSIHPSIGGDDHTFSPSNAQRTLQPTFPFPLTGNRLVQSQQNNLDISRQRHKFQATTDRNNLQNDKNIFNSDFQAKIRQNQGSTRHQQISVRQSSTGDVLSSRASPVSNGGSQPQQNLRLQNQNRVPVSVRSSDQWILQQLQPSEKRITQQIPSKPLEFPGPSALTNQNQQKQNTQFNDNSHQRNDEMLRLLLATLNRQKTKNAVSGNTNNGKPPQQQFNDDDIALALLALVRELQQSPNTVTRRNGNPSHQNTLRTNNGSAPSMLPTSANQGQQNVQRGNTNNFSQQGINPWSVSAWPTTSQQQIQNAVWTNNVQANPSIFTRSNVPTSSRIGDDNSAHPQAPVNNNPFHFQGISTIGDSTSAQQHLPANNNRLHFQGTSTIGDSTSAQQHLLVNNNRLHFQGTSTTGDSTSVQQLPANNNRLHFQGASTTGDSTSAQQHLPVNNRRFQFHGSSTIGDGISAQQRSPANNNRLHFQGTNVFRGNTAGQQSTNRGQFWTHQNVPMPSQSSRINTGIPDQFGNVRILRFEVPEAARVGQPFHQAFQFSPLNIISSNPTFLLSGTKDRGLKATAEKMLVPKKTDSVVETAIATKKGNSQNGEQMLDSNA